MAKRRYKRRYSLEDKALLFRLKRAANEGRLEECFVNMMNALMSDKLPVRSNRTDQEIDRLRVGVALQLASMANKVAMEKGIDISFVPMHPDLIFSKPVSRRK